MHASKDLLEKTLVAVIQLAGDSLPEARYYARCCLNQLWPLPEFDSAVSRLSDQMRRRAKESVDNLKTKVEFSCVCVCGGGGGVGARRRCTCKTVFVPQLYIHGHVHSTARLRLK